MNWSEFSDARLLMAEERVGSRMREQDRSDLEKDAQANDILRSRGLVDGPR